VTPVNLEANLQKFLGGDTANPDGRDPEERNASFDYCFNYFQSFRDSGDIPALANPENLQVSCLQLGFYLASWGMLRGSTDLLQKSAMYLIPVVRAIATTDASLWAIDADCYDEPNIQRLLDLADKISGALPDISVTPTLKTKIMLGVFGSVPAFDDTFAEGCEAEGWGLVKKFDREALESIAAFYQRNAAVIDSDKYRVRTLDFSGGYAMRRYTRAKVIDMALSTEGEKTGPERKRQVKGKRRKKGTVDQTDSAVRRTA
jgi:hypothetical protein